MMYKICTKVIVAKSYLPAPKYEIQRLSEKNDQYNLET